MAERKVRLPVTRPAAWDDPRDVQGDDHAASAQGSQPDVEIGEDALYDAVVAVLKSIYDPEIPVNLYDLGLIYEIDIADDREVAITMTLTAPACPVAGSIVKEVADRVAQIAGVARSRVHVVWDPPWSKDRMTEAARLELGFF